MRSCNSSNCSHRSSKHCAILHLVQKHSPLILPHETMRHAPSCCRNWSCVMGLLNIGNVNLTAASCSSCAREDSSNHMRQGSSRRVCSGWGRCGCQEQRDQKRAHLAGRGAAVCQRDDVVAVLVSCAHRALHTAVGLGAAGCASGSRQRRVQAQSAQQSVGGPVQTTGIMACLTRKPANTTLRMLLWLSTNCRLVLHARSSAASERQRRRDATGRHGTTPVAQPECGACSAHGSSWLRAGRAGARAHLAKPQRPDLPWMTVSPSAGASCSQNEPPQAPRLNAPPAFTLAAMAGAHAGARLRDKRHRGRVCAGVAKARMPLVVHAGGWGLTCRGCHRALVPAPDSRQRLAGQQSSGRACVRACDHVSASLCEQRAVTAAGASHVMGQCSTLTPLSRAAAAVALALASMLVLRVRSPWVCASVAVEAAAAELGSWCRQLCRTLT